MIFWDTSAFVRCYSRDEPGQDRAANLLASRERQSGSVLLLPEVTGVLSRMAGSNQALRDKVLKEARAALSEFELVPAGIAQAELAARIAVSSRLKGADALHVAAAFLLARELGSGFRFITSDAEQAAVAKSEKFRVILVN